MWTNVIYEMGCFSFDRQQQLGGNATVVTEIAAGIIPICSIHSFLPVYGSMHYRKSRIGPNP